MHAVGQPRVVFSTPPFETDTEITGPVNLKLYVSSSSDDMDIFAIVRNIGPDGEEVTFEGTNNPQSPVTAGWLRASQRKTDPARSTPYRPFHSHDEVQKLTPGKVVPVEVEIWPTSMVFEKGHAWCWKSPRATARACGHSCTPTRATAASPEPTRSTPAARPAHTCCCRSSRRAIHRACG